MSGLNDLVAAQRKLREQADRHKNQRAYRDHLIREALQSGHTWASIQSATGLTARAVALAVKRE